MAMESVLDVAVGDVVLYRTVDGRIIAHRVVGRLRRKTLAWVLCPDAAPGAWERVPESDVLGRVVSMTRGGRRHQLDRGAWWFLGVLWARSYPLNRALQLGLRTARFVARRIQSRRFGG